MVDSVLQRVFNCRVSFFSLGLNKDNSFEHSHVPYYTLRSKGTCKLLSDRSASIYERSISVMNSKRQF